jgi:1-acyl-sn-glycerol-3-phosphate acyltransferase
MNQEEGIIGKIVGGMIRRSVRSRFRNVYWRPPGIKLTAPVIFYVNHHGWLDGYVMFHVITKLGIRCLDWIQEFDAFPLFSKIGGMRFTSGDLPQRVKTVRKTIKLMRTENRSLIIFPEGVMHRPPEVWQLGRSLETVAKKVPGVTLVPVSIIYEHSIHERPEAWVTVGEPHAFDSLGKCKDRLELGLFSLKSAISQGEQFDLLACGTPDVNERMSMKRFRNP